MKPKFIASSTLEALEKGCYKTESGKTVDLKGVMKNAISGTRMFTPGDLDKIVSGIVPEEEFNTEYELVNDTTMNVVRRCFNSGDTNIACLNFASARNPGGGFLSGAVAQEESIARASGLYPCLLRAKPYYDFHRKLDTCLYSDHMIYSPMVPVIKDENGKLLDAPVFSAFITSPAINAGAIMKNEPHNVEKMNEVMQRRVEKVLALGHHYKHDTLILGAWGCGVFQNKPEHIAGMFYNSLSGVFKNKFRKIVWAVYSSSDDMIAPFDEMVKRLTPKIPGI